MTKVELREQLELTLSRNVADIVAIVGQLNPSRIDMFKLQNLKTWAERYALSLEEVIDLLLKASKERGKVKRTARSRLTTSVLVNNQSKTTIQAYILKTYPNKENEGIVRDAYRDRILPASAPVQMDDPFSFVAEYKKYIKDIRKGDKLIEDKFKEETGEAALGNIQGT